MADLAAAIRGKLIAYLSAAEDRRHRHAHAPRSGGPPDGQQPAGALPDAQLPDRQARRDRLDLWPRAPLGGPRRHR
jgi:hypothetical protein